MNDIIYRAFDPKTDFEAGIHLHQILNTAEANMDSQRDPSFDAARLCLEEDIRLVAEQGGEILVADIAGKVIGYCSYLLDRRGPYMPAEWRPYVYVKNLMVEESHRGRGIGARFLDHAEGFARKSRVKLICLNVVTGNEGAKALYRKHGYRPTNTEMAKPLD